MKIGDLVQYRGWKDAGPLALVVEQVSPDSDYHHRIRVAWVGDKIPIQASALSTNGNRITTWVNPKHFKIISKNAKEN